MPTIEKLFVKVLKNNEVEPSEKHEQNFYLILQEFNERKKYEEKRKYLEISKN